MKLIIGLGNPGEKYQQTRHNAGFMAISYLRQKLNLPDFQFNKKFNAEISQTSSVILERSDRIPSLNSTIILVKPQTFMNESGKSVKALINFYKVDPKNDLIIIHDEIDLMLGEIRMSQDRGSAGHRGIESIFNELGTKNFQRIRLGVNSETKGQIPTEDFVLRKFETAEIKILEKIFEHNLDQVV